MATKAKRTTKSVKKAEKTEKTKKTKKTRAAEPEYAFPSRSRCPRCQASDTRAVSTQGNVQYRQCIRPICRQRYKVIGKAL